MTVRVAEPASRGVPLSVAVTTSLSANIYIYIYTVSARVFTPMQFCGDWMYEMTHLVSVQISLSMMAAVVMLPVSGSILNKPLMDDDLRE